jgi:opacity protein-like surface antigen
MNLTALSRSTKSITIASLIALVSLLGTGVAGAQSSTDGPIVPGEWTVTPFIGFGFSGDLDSATGALGVAGGYNYNSKISIEGEFALLPSPENNGAVEVDSTVWTLTGNLLYHFAKKNNFTPYAVAGIGFGHASVDVNGTILAGLVDASSTQFVANIGGGVERQFSDRLRFRGDLRYMFGGDSVPDYWRLSAGVSIVLPHKQ